MEYVKFGEFINSVQYGYTADSTGTIGDKQYLRITDIVPYFVDKDKVPYVSIDDKKSEKYVLKKDDLLIARTGATTGYNLIVPEGFENFIFASYLVRYFYDKEKLYPLYLKYVLKSKQWYGFINNFIGGSAQPGMNPKTMGKFELPYHKYDNQKIIAKILNTYDLYIENNNKRIKILEDMAENLYKEWFVRFRFPGYENAEFENGIPKGWVLSEDENKIQKPKGWYFGELKDIASFVRGKNITSSEMIEGEIPVISAGLEPSGYHNKSNVLGQSITVSSSGANAGYLSYHLSDIWAADCSYYNNQENLWFIYNTLKFLQPVISNLQVGAAQPHVYAKNINKLSVIIPEEKYILMYCQKVKSIYLEIKTLQDMNGNLEKQRDALLPKLMSGKLEI